MKYFLKDTRTFRKSFKKLKKSGISIFILDEFIFIVNSLLEGKKLPLQYKDHNLKGNFLGNRECHIKGDLLLVYEIKEEKKCLVLHDIGSHSQIFG